MTEKRPLRDEWSPETAKIIEDSLLQIVSGVPEVNTIRGCSARDYHDYKINFRHSGSIAETHSYFLEFKPQEGLLRAWSAGLGYKFPPDVFAHIQKMFPNTRYHMGSGPGVEGFHIWNGVQQSQLPKAL